MTLRLLTYNLHHQPEAPLLEPRADQIARLVENHDIAIACFQELATSQSGSFLSRLSALTGMHPVFCPCLRRGGQSYGNGLVTRLPADEYDCLALPTSGPAEARSVIKLRTRVRATSLSIWSGHLSLTPWDQTRQAAKIIEDMKADGSEVQILAGDLNTWSRYVGAGAALDRAFGKPQETPRTFPARLPMLRLDQIRVKPGRLLKRTRTLSEDTLSDHLPLMAEIALPAERWARTSRKLIHAANPWRAGRLARGGGRHRNFR